MRWSRARTVPLLSALVLLGAVTGCSDGGSDASGGKASASTEASATTSPGDAGTSPTEPVIVPDEPAPELDPSGVVAVVDNPYMPLVPGSTWVYEGTDDGEEEHVEVEVLTETRMVMGIAATVVRDRVSVGGEVVEDTFDWYAQDAEGNVWYLGEDSKEIEDGEVVGTEGSWEAGVDGARPGIVMPATPTPGDAYRQELAEGVAEDMAEVIDPPASIDTGAGTSTDLVRTREWNPLEPDVVEEKTYAAGIGVVREVKVRGGEGEVVLVEHVPAR